MGGLLFCQQKTIVFSGPPAGSEWPVPGQELWQRRYAKTSRPFSKPQKRHRFTGGKW